MATENTLLVALSGNFLLITFMFLRTIDFKCAFLTFVAFSFLQIKLCHYVAFFVNLLNFRLEELLGKSKIDPSQEALKLHTKLFLLSRLIKSHRDLMGLITFKTCYALVFQCFSIFFHAINFNLNTLFFSQGHATEIRLHLFITSGPGGEVEKILTLNTKKKNSSYKKSDMRGGGHKS